MKKLKILLSVILCLTLSSCNNITNIREPNDMSYIIAVGVDKGEESNYYVTIQYAKPLQITGSSEGGGGSGEDTMETLTISAPNVYSALDMADQIISKKFSLDHTKLIVFSDQVAKLGLSNFTETMARNPSIRPNIYLAVSLGTAKDYLESVKPLIEMSPTRYYELIFENNYSLYSAPSIAQNFYSNEDSPFRENVLPLCGEFQDSSNSKDTEESTASSNNNTQAKLNELPESYSPLNKNEFEYNLYEYVAGELPRKSKNKSQTIGMAVFLSDKMVGTMNNIESKIYNMLTTTYSQNNVTFYCQQSPQTPINIQLEEDINPKIKVDVSSDKPKIYMKLFLEGECYSLPAQYSLETDINQLEDEIEGYIKKACSDFLYRTSIEFESDIVGFGEYAKRDFVTYNDFMKYDWINKYKDSEFNIDVSLELRRSGLTTRSDQK